MSIPMPPDADAQPADDQPYPDLDAGANSGGRSADPGPGRLRFVHIGEHMAGFMEELELNRTKPLVTIDDVDVVRNSLAVTLYDRALPHFRYEFWVRGADDALQWMQHLSEKNWVTVRHLALLATYVREHYDASGMPEVMVLTKDQVRAARAAQSEARRT